MKEIIQKIFRNKGLQIIVQCNLKIANYLDVTLYLNERYITNLFVNLMMKQHKSTSNLTIVKLTPRSIEKRLSQLSLINEIFENSKDYHEQGLKQKLTTKT